MADRFKTYISSTNLQKHPAVIAWSTVSKRLIAPEQIVVMKDKKKCSVYRIQNIGQSGSIIAKRCLLGTGEIERFLYEEVLLHLPVSTTQYYGYLEDSKNNCFWLFLEDAGDGVYVHYTESHRLLATQWLSLLHTSAWQLPLLEALPDRGPKYFLNNLHSAVDKISNNIVNPTLSDEDRKTLKTIISQLKIAQLHWSEVENFCSGMPQTLVHNDFIEKNIRVRNSDSGITLLPFDWEMAGYGVPAVDIAKVPDMHTYWLQARQTWPSLTIQDIWQMSTFGKLFRTIAAINWFSWVVSYPREEWHMRVMVGYATRINECLNEAGWEG